MCGETQAPATLAASWQCVTLTYILIEVLIKSCKGYHIIRPPPSFCSPFFTQ